MLLPAEAARAIVAHVSPLPTEVALLRDAVLRVLAEPVRAPLALPPWDNSAMDGYAVRSEDVRGATPERPRVLRVIETVPAGAFPTRPVGAGEAVRIFTGAPLPDGADGVIRQEDTAVVAGDRVAVRDDRDAGRNVRHRGEDIREGEEVLSTGVVLGPAALGVLASIGRPEVRVHRAPRVALLGSGDEIVDLDRADEVLAGRKIASSNSYTLHANVRLAGGIPCDLGIARDDAESLRAHLQGAAGADLIVTTAGVSVGEHDVVRSVLEELGLKLEFWRVAMRPGAPVGFGVLDGTPWLGLPGNPVSTMVTFELFVRPAIRRLAGHRLPFRRTVSATLEETIHTGPRLRHFLRVVLRERPDGGLSAALTGPQGSGILTSMARADGLLIVPEDRSVVEAGERLAVLRLDEPTHVAEPPF